VLEINRQQPTMCWNHLPT